MGLYALICEKKWGNLDFSLFKMLHFFKTFFIKVKSLLVSSRDLGNGAEVQIHLSFSVQVSF